MALNAVEERLVNPRPLAGRVALVTGAARGIGRAIAVELARAGAGVAALDLPTAEEALGELVSSLGEEFAVPARWYAADVTSSADIGRVVEAVAGDLGGLGILVNNAGITRDRSLLNQSDAEWDAVLRVNLDGPRHCTRAAAAVMRRQGWGRIVNIASVVGQIGAFGQTNYAAAKGGLIAFTKAAARELAKHNITVNAVCPGYVDAAMTAAIPDFVWADLARSIPLGRKAQPEEIARAVRFLVAEGDYITGQEINVNGGLYM